MSKIIEAGDLPEGEKIYLKKDFLGWRVVEPIYNEQGKLIWSRLIFGSRKNIIIILFIIVMVLILYFGVQELISNYKVIADNPCYFCNLVNNNISLNFSGGVINNGLS